MNAPLMKLLDASNCFRYSKLDNCSASERELLFKGCDTCNLVSTSVWKSSVIALSLSSSTVSVGNSVPQLYAFAQQAQPKAEQIASANPLGTVASAVCWSCSTLS